MPHRMLASCCLAALLAAAIVATSTSAQETKPAAAAPAGVQASRYGAGTGPRWADDTWHLLDDAHTAGQSNAIAFDRATPGAFERLTLNAKLRVLEGGDGGAFVFLNTAHYAVQGPAPFVPSVVEPNLRGTFAVGIDVHNPPNTEPFGPWGNYQGLPQREISLHFDGRELVKRVAPVEFRGGFAEFSVAVQHVAGGAEVTVRVAGGTVFDRMFVANFLPYETRLAVVAGTRSDAVTEFDVKDLRFESAQPAARRRPAVHVEVFNHVLTDNSKTEFVREVTLPPIEWNYGRVIMTIDLHDAGEAWDEWDRCGEVSVILPQGRKLGLVPFITSYRTECHWAVDVTHFRPLLAGRTKLEIAAGTNFYKNRGYMMSLSLDFHHAGPVPADAVNAAGTAVPSAVVPLWVGTAQYKSAENHFQDFFTPQTVSIGADVVAARLFITTTGHSQVGEFTPSKRAIIFAPRKDAPAAEVKRVENVLWKADCYLNPNRPQYGTWKYSRAGWAPGDVVAPWWVDLTPWIVPGQDATIKYEPQPYEFPPGETPSAGQINEASHNVRAYLILYRKPGAGAATMIPPSLMVTNVADNSNAAKAGVRPGDFLASYDSVEVLSVDDLRGAIGAARQAGKATVKVVVYRGAARMEVEVGTGPLGVGLSGN